MAKKVAKAPDPRFEVLRMLTEEQKDKLLLKLFRKDPSLVEKLAFEFFEDKSDLKQRIEKIKQSINKYVSNDYMHWATPGELMMTMRSENASITEHVKITKDKLGEVELTILLLNTAFDRFWDMLVEKQKRADTFSEYVIKRTENILKAAKKLHPDNDLDFQSELNRLLAYIYKFPPTATIAKANGIPPQYFR
ncbi:MAG: hypothetical protein JNL70_16825 [Saprospiraceae bacterium]|nr:hypothetical protein [Saprospiraceae bacterium]